jgi:hypothetical protein
VLLFVSSSTTTTTTTTADRPPLSPFTVVIILLKQFISSICSVLCSLEHDDDYDDDCDVIFVWAILPSIPAADPATSTATPKDQTENLVAVRRSTSALSVPKSTTGSPI